MKWGHFYNEDSVAYTPWDANTVRYFIQGNEKERRSIKLSGKLQDGLEFDMEMCLCL